MMWGARARVKVLQIGHRDHGVFPPNPIGSFNRIGKILQRPG
jgi:hypothetical protein